MSDQEGWSGFEIAVIGMACRFPGAPDVATYWKNLAGGVESIRHFDKEELRGLKGDKSHLVDSPGFVPAHGVVDGYDLFDPEFFGYSPREAGVMDPQQRLFLELAWEAMEDAGYAPGSLDVPVGVFSGTTTNSYLASNVRRNPRVLAAISEFQANVLNQNDFLSTRASYKLGLRGPAFSVQSACSTSLIAAHLACQQLLSGACEMALAGGVSLTLPDDWGYQYQEGMIFSPDGHCRAFDEQAKGTLKGDGGGIVVLKRLSDALEDGDHVEAIILGSAANNDGAEKVGYTAPGLSGQVEVISTAQLLADVTPRSVSYIECHGTGTPMGDPIEVAALTQAFGVDEDKQYCAIGSVKTNIGHLDAGAGVAGLMKTVLALKHATLPPSLNYQTPNPTIHFEQTPFYVNAVCQPWQSDSAPRRAGVSSFGIGGTNAHLVLQEAPVASAASGDDNKGGLHGLRWSAKTREARDAYGEQLLAFLESGQAPDMGDIAFTLATGREAFGWRGGLVCRDAADAIDILKAGKAPRLVGAEAALENVAAVFMFPGQGAQYPGMGQGLYNTEPEYRRIVDECSSILQQHLDLDLREILYPAAADKMADAEALLTQTRITQPALFVTEYALAQLLICRGITPAAVVGHSIGEYVAACVAGVISLEDALLLVARRGELMQMQAPGGMITVPMPAPDVEPLLAGGLSIAAINSPAFCVVAGPDAELEALTQRLAESDVDCKRLKTSHAFHSSMMEPALEPFAEALKQCQLRSPTLKMVSTVYGDWVNDELASADYWLRNLRDTVNFSAAASVLLEREDYVFVEVGPGTTLTSLLRSCAQKPAAVATVNSLRHPADDIDDTAHLESSLIRMWALGLDAAREAITPSNGRRISIPTYAFQRKRCWVEPADLAERGADGGVAVPQLDVKLALEDWFYSPSWLSKRLPVRVEGAEQRCNWLVVAPELAPELAREEILSQSLQFDAHNVFHVSQLRELQAYLPSLLEPADDASAALPLHILFCTEPAAPAAALPKPAARDFWRLLAVVQLVAEFCDLSRAGLTVLAPFAVDVSGGAGIDPERIMPAGILRALQVEYPGLSCRMISTDADLSQPSAALTQELLAEHDDFLVALEGNRRWVQRLEPVVAPRSDQGAPRFRPRGTYLITGGLGTVGLAVAEYLASEYEANLVLTSRDPLPTDEEANIWLAAHDSEDFVSNRIRAVRRLRAAGASVTVATVDVSDLDAMQTVRDQLESTYGSVNGVIHAAGIPGGGVVAMLQREKAEAVLTAKVTGSWVLAQVFAQSSLDFMVFCSSLTSFVSRPGRAEYTAANLYMDALANELNNQGLIPAVSINWDAWSGSGMNRDSSGLTAVNRIESDEGVAALLRCLALGWPQVVVSTREMLADQRRSTAGIAGGVSADNAALADVKPLIDKDAPGAPRNEVETIFAEIWIDLLGLDTIAVTDNFFELGGDSIISLQLVSRAAEAGVSLSSKQVFEFQTIEELAGSTGAPVPQGPESNSTGDTNSVDEEATAVPVEVAGDVALTPIQHWFFEQSFAGQEQWNLEYLLESPAGIEPAQLEILVAFLFGHHDALRIGISGSAGNWQQFNHSLEVSLPLTRVDISGRDDVAVSALMAEETLKANASFKFEGGTLVRFLFFDRGPDQSGYLLIVAHHLIADIISFQILNDHLNRLLLQQQRGDSLTLPHKSTSFQEWSNGLQRLAQNAIAPGARAYWESMARADGLSLPCDFPGSDNTVESAAEVQHSVPEAVTAALLSVVPRQGFQVNELLVSALVIGLSEFSGKSELAIDFEGHGRDPMEGDLEVSRTVGWFTQMYPCVFTVPSLQNATACLGDVRTTLQQAMDHGRDFGLLRYLESDASEPLAFPGSPVVFLYQGKQPTASVDETIFRAAKNGLKASRNAQQRRTHLLECTALITAGQLQFSMGYSSALHKRETITRLLSRLVEIITTLVSALDSANTVATVPSSAVSPATSAVATAATEPPLSFAQERVWFLEQIEAAARIHNKHMVLKLAGSLDHDCLRQAVDYVVNRHEALRTTFVLSQGQPVRQMLDHVALDIPITEIDPDAATMAPLIAEFSEREVSQLFSLERGPLIRLHLLSAGAADHYLLVTIHHIVTDAWSMQVFLREFPQVYQQLAEKKQPTLPALPWQYSDFVRAQQDHANSALFEAQLGYWRQRLAGDIAPLELPYDHLRPAVQRYAGDRVSFELPADTTTQLRQFAASQGSSMFMTMLAVFKILLARYSGQTDIVVGTPVANRNRVELEGMVGLLVNNLALRSDLSLEQDFKSLLAQVRNTVLDANERAEVPFERIVHALNPPRDRSRSPIFQVMMVYMNAPQAGSQDGPLGITPIEIHNGISEYDFSLYVMDEGAARGEGRALTAWVEFSTDLFNTATIQRMVSHYLNLLQAVMAEPDRLIGSLPLLSAQERQAQLERSARPLLDTGGAENLNALVSRFFDQKASTNAVISGGAALSYGELDALSAKVAAQLQRQGVGPGVPVAIFMERSSSMLVAMLAVWRAGGCYVPLDPTYPQDRIKYMLDDCESRWIITQESLAGVLPEGSYTVLLEDEWQHLEAAPLDVVSTAAPSDLAYIIYTSGSTGLPKGVRVERANVANFLESMAAEPGLNEDDVLVAVTTICFDIHVLELWLPLAVGARLVIATGEECIDGFRLLELLRQEEATTMQATPATWQMLLQCGWDAPLALKILCGGEALTRSLADKLLPLCTALWNMYGPTETCVWSAVEKISPGAESISIGKPIANTQFYIAGSGPSLLPDGVAGELLIGGKGVVRDYHAREELTAERFIQNPFIESADASTDRLYRTGDLARWLADGRVQVLGRLDDQVKLRGYRIELGEIEAMLRKHESVIDAVVAVRGPEDDRRLVAWLRSGAADTPGLKVIRAFLATSLPDYMLPAAVVWLDEFPKTANNKIDKRALPDAVSETLAVNEMAETGAEKFVAGLFADVLGIERVGRLDNFFDLGGHSLLSMKVVTRLEESTGTKIHPGELFQQTVGQIAATYEQQIQDSL